MEISPLNVFILAEHALVANGLKHRLKQKFGSAVETRVFCDVYQCLREVAEKTGVLVIDETLESKCAEVWGRQFRAVFPQIEVLNHHSREQVVGDISALLRYRLVPEAAAVFVLV